MDSITKLLIDFFHIDNIGLYLAAALMVTGVFVILVMLMKFMKVSLGLARMTKIVQSPKDEAEFTANYESIREQVLNIPEQALFLSLLVHLCY